MLQAAYRHLVVMCALVIVSASFANEACAESVRFVVGRISGPPRDESYVLQLSDPAAITHARELIAHGPSVGEPLVVADVAHGADGINRNYAAPNAPLWTWHVSQFLGFADVTAEILDGRPSFLENGIYEPIHETFTSIGFWSYSIVAELPQGDYDGDLNVDGADYNTWRRSFGATIKNLGADGSGNGVVDLADYVVWRKHFAQSGGVSHQPTVNASVPEPSSLNLSMLCTALWLISAHRRVSSRQIGWLHE